MKLKVYFLCFLSGFSLQVFSQEKADILILNKEYDKALHLIDQMLARTTTAAGLYLKKGLIYNKLQMYPDAVSALEKANEMDTGNPEILFEIATTYEEFNSNKTLALNYYQIYLKEAGAAARNMEYAQDRIAKIKEEMFFEE